MENKNRKLLFLLNIVYTIFSVVAIVTGFVSFSGDEFNILLSVSIAVIFTMGIIGIWMFYAGKVDSSILILKIKKIVKFIVVIIVLWLVCILLFAAQDCSSSVSGNNVTLLDRLSVSWPFILIAVFAFIYMITYLIFYNAIKKDNVSKKLMLIVAIENIVYICGIIVHIVITFIDNNIDILILLSEILYIIVLSLSIILIFNKYQNNTFDKNSKLEYNN